jgi:hypothetical protein
MLSSSPAPYKPSRRAEYGIVVIAVLQVVNILLALVKG